jgi:hypothetical protein
MLLQNLYGSPDATWEALAGFLEAFTYSMPTGHQTTFAHRTLPSLLSVVVRGDQPVNLVSAFERPVRPDGEGITRTSANRTRSSSTRPARSAWPRSTSGTPPTTTWPRPLMRPERGPTSCTARRRHCAARACATPLTARRPWRLPGTVAGRLSRVAGLRRRSPALRTGSDTIQASWARAAELVTSRRYRDQAGRPRPQCPLGWPQCGPSSRYPAMAGLSTTLVQPSSRLSKCSYASGARRSGRRWETIHDGLARPAWMRSRSRRL